MVFSEKVYSLIAKTGVTKNKMLSDLNINHNAFAKWDKNDCLPDGKNIIKVAQYFNVSTDYLLGLSPEPAPVAMPEVYDLNEAELVKAFRSLAPEGKALSVDYVRLLHDRFPADIPVKKTNEK